MAGEYIQGVRRVQSTTEPEMLLKLRADSTNDGLFTMKAAVGITISDPMPPFKDDELLLVSPYATAEIKDGQTFTRRTRFHQLIVQNNLYDEGDLDRYLEEFEKEKEGKFIVCGGFMILRTLEGLSAAADTSSVSNGLYGLARIALSDIWAIKGDVTQVPTLAPPYEPNVVL